MSIIAGVAVADGIEAAAGLGVHLKWPNDVYIGGRKLGAGGHPRHVIVGIGINLMPASVPPVATGRAADLESELGLPVSPNASPRSGAGIASCRRDAPPA